MVILTNYMSIDNKLKHVHDSLKLKFKGKELVLGQGFADAKIVFVTDIPGVEEEKAGKPLVGKSAKLFNQLLKRYGINRRHVYLTSALKHRFPEGKEPSPKELKVHATFLKEEIRTINPQFVITFGNTALNGVGLRQPLDNVHGKTFHLGTYELLPTFHPNHALRDQRARTLLESDFIKLKELMKPKDIA